MELVIDFGAQYKEFVRRNNSSGYCQGFCLVWLGDILKNRTIQDATSFATKWTKGWLSSTAPIANIPTDKASLEALFQRAKRRHENYKVQSENRDPCNVLSRNENVMNYKNSRQISKEFNGGGPILEFRFKKLDNICLAKGLGYSGQLHGDIIAFFSPILGGQHAVAQISISPNEAYFLDPNIGLYKLDSQMVNDEVVACIGGNYDGAAMRSQLTIKRKY